MVAVGDSITQGVTRSGVRRPEPRPMRLDPAGGYPGRLAVLLDGGVRVVNRGIGGSLAGGWLAPTNAAAIDVLTKMWSDFHPGRAPGPRESLFDFVLATERPDVVLLL